MRAQGFTRTETWCALGVWHVHQGSDACVRTQGFDPDRDLVRIGLANQTTMLRDETMAIGKMLEAAQMQKHGPAALQQHYMVMDTICDATQARSSSSSSPLPLS